MILSMKLEDYIMVKHRKPKTMSSFDGKLYDIANIDCVQITIAPDAKVIWVNTESGCVLRIKNISQFEIVDDRINSLEKACAADSSMTDNEANR